MNTSRRNWATFYEIKKHLYNYITMHFLYIVLFCSGILGGKQIYAYLFKETQDIL